MKKLILIAALLVACPIQSEAQVEPVSGAHWTIALADLASYERQNVRRMSGHITGQTVISGPNTSFEAPIEPKEGVVTLALINKVLAEHAFVDVKMATREQYAHGTVWLYGADGKLSFTGGYNVDTWVEGPVSGELKFELARDFVDVRVPEGVSGVQIFYSDARGGGTAWLSVENGVIRIPRNLSGRKGTVKIYHDDGTQEVRDLATGAELPMQENPPITLKARYFAHEEYTPSDAYTIDPVFNDWEVTDNGETASVTVPVHVDIASIAIFARTDRGRVARSLKVRELPNGEFSEEIPLRPDSWLNERIDRGVYDIIFRFDPWPRDDDDGGKGVATSVKGG